MELRDRLFAIQEKKREAQKREAEELRRKREAEANQPIVVKVIEVNINEEYIYKSNAILENNPAIYHRGYVNFLQGIQGRVYLSVDVGKSNKNMIPCTELGYVMEKLSNMDNITVDWDFKAYQRFKEWKQLREEWESRPDFWVDYDGERKQFIIKQGAGSTYTMEYVYGTRRHSTKKETIWTLALTEGYRLKELTVNIEYSTLAEQVLEEEKKKKEAQKDISEKKDSEIEVNFLDGLELRPFQKVGVEFAANANGNAIIADGTGLGKTWQAIGLCEYLKRPAIIVCPASVKENWRREIKRLTGHDAYVCKGGTPGEWDVEMFAKGTFRYIIMNYDILGKGFEIKQDDGKKIIRYFWADVIRETGTYKQMIFDEAHKIKNTSANRTKATLHLGDNMNYLFLTATPVLNRPRELYSPLRLIRPNQYLSEQHFLENYMWSDGQVRNVDHLRETLSTILIRRKREDVQKDLPPIERIYDWYELSEQAMVRYNLAMEGLYISLAEFDPEKRRNEQQITGILAQITRLKQIVAQDKVERIAELATELVDSEQGEGEGKVVIFSGFKPVSKGIAARLGHEAVHFDGDIPPAERQPIVDQFQNDPNIKFLVATGQTAGEGLTMTAGGYVIFSDFGWTPAYHQQCEGRIYGRLNEAHGAISYYIVGINTIEEWIQEILARKLKIIEQIVEGNMEEDAGKNMGYELIKRIKKEKRKPKQ
jgi:SWI/SNF-related matrix-associated actin-dependent regulator 1 of chromatin subfamily A